MRPAWLVSATLSFVTACATVHPSEAIGVTATPTVVVPPPAGPLSFDFDSLDERSVSAPALRGKPAVLAFLVSDSLAGQGEASIVAELAATKPDAARFAVVAVEPADRRELVQSFLRFFTEKTHGALLGAMADPTTLKGEGPFGDVRGLTVVVLDAGGRVVFRQSGLVHGTDIARVLSTM